MELSSPAGGKIKLGPHSVFYKTSFIQYKELEVFELN